MKPLYAPTVIAGSQSGIPGNDSRHNKVEPTNKSGGPSIRTRRMIPPANRGGTGHQGRDRTHVKARMGGGRSTASNPAGRAGAVGSETADTRNPNAGGGVQTRRLNVQRQFGKSGKDGVVNDYAHSKPGPAGKGNVSGRMSKRVSGHFNNRSKKSSGAFGGGPVSEDV